MLRVAVYVSLLPLGRLGVPLILHSFPARRSSDLAPVQVQVQVRDAGKVSATVAPVALLGPALLEGTGLNTEPRAVAVVMPSLALIARSALAAPVSLSVAALVRGVGSVAAAGAGAV